MNESIILTHSSVSILENQIVRFLLLEVKSRHTRVKSSLFRPVSQFPIQNAF